MLCLLFHLGKERYAIEARSVVEVLPIVHIKKLPLAPRGVAGLMHYRGATVPVLDLSALATPGEASRKLSTRILVVYFRSQTGADRLLGLLAERATESLHLKETDFRPSEIQLPDAPFLGAVANDSNGIIQKIEISQLIPFEVQKMLFSELNG